RLTLESVPEVEEFPLPEPELPEPEPELDLPDSDLTVQAKTDEAAAADSDRNGATAAAEASPNGSQSPAAKTVEPDPAAPA
ncbi:MAG: hypothetical protein ICV62_08540, partial [Cyanobacteria bacterium Co-bin13]|nr:hypothetical protein [Cyanobacteria bacterium Co-bin13]